MHFWPYVGKAKRRLRAVEFFWKNCKQTAEKCKQIEKTTATQTHIGFTYIGSEMHSFRGTAIWNNGFWFGLPCTIRKFPKMVLLFKLSIFRFCFIFTKFSTLCNITTAISQKMEVEKKDTKKTFFLQKETHCFSYYISSVLLLLHAEKVELVGRKKYHISAKMF